MANQKSTFKNLIQAITHVDKSLLIQATKAINISLTLRNWLIGAYIHIYEQKGIDRARYGEKLLGSIADQLEKMQVSRSSERELRRYRQFYLTYPQIRESVTPEFRILLPIKISPLRKRESATPKLTVLSNVLLEHLSFTHFVELLQIEDPFKRAFYERECIRSNWSVRELKRQIATLYFERTHLSKNKKKLAAPTQKSATQIVPELIVRDPYVFEFLGLKAKEVMGESNLEDALLDKLQDFLLELGHGFCFEARQKRIVIGDEYFFVDLVFYHRVLKCHVLIELKADDFKHEHLGQLNTYVNYYRRHEISDGDNPPVGILLCTKKNHALVEYALDGINNRLFVSKYQVELPKKQEIQKFLEKQLKNADLRSV